MTRTLKLYLSIDQDAQEQLVSLHGEEQQKDNVTTDADNQLIGRELHYHKILCADLWDGEVLHEEISGRLLLIKNFFMEKLKKYINIVDVVLIGSLAGYTYDKLTELDVCLIYNLVNNKDDAILIKKNIKSIVCHWNRTSNVVWNGHKVNILIQVENDSSGMVSSGEYSLFKKKWMKKSTCDSPVLNLADVQTKYCEFMNEVLCMEEMFNLVIEGAVVESCYHKACSLLKKIYGYREHGLLGTGENSFENVIFRMLKRDGYIRRLERVKFKLFDKEYSVSDL